MNLLEIQQFSEKIVHFCIAECTLHLHVLHDLQRDGLEWGQTQEKLRESLRGHGVHGLGAVLERLEDLLLEDFHLLFGSGAQAFGICASKQRKRQTGVIKFEQDRHAIYIHTLTLSHTHIPHVHAFLHDVHTQNQ